MLNHITLKKLNYEYHLDANKNLQNTKKIFLTGSVQGGAATCCGVRAQHRVDSGG